MDKPSIPQKLLPITLEYQEFLASLPEDSLAELADYIVCDFVDFEIAIEVNSDGISQPVKNNEHAK